MKDILTFTTPETRWLSNMAYVNIEYVGIIYPSIENFYQAMKYNESSCMFVDWTPKRVYLREHISTLKPHEAKKFSREKEWTNMKFEGRKLEIMLYAQRKKYSQEPFKSKLLSTGDNLLGEGNWWGDKFWGVDIGTRIGENNLGRIIMQVREELKCKLS